MSNIYDLADTWNAAGTTFTAIKMNVTDTASQAASLLMDLQVGGSSRFSVSKAGTLALAGNILPSGAIVAGLYVTGQTGLYIGVSTDVQLNRDAANVLALRNSTAAQTYRMYGTYTDASNYRRVSLAMTTAGVATLLPEGAGTGASGNVLHISGLPTSNPGAGILWNNAGTPAIGT